MLFYPLRTAAEVKMGIIERLWKLIEERRNRTHDDFGNKIPEVTFGHPALDEKE
jgi:hypothetical protein